MEKYAIFDWISGGINYYNTPEEAEKAYNDELKEHLKDKLRTDFDKMLITVHKEYNSID